MKYSPAVRLLNDTATLHGLPFDPDGFSKDVERYGAERALAIYVKTFDPAERPTVEAFLDDRSILFLLQEEARHSA